MNGYWLLRRLAISLVITGGLWLLTGCQGLTGGSKSASATTVTPGTLTANPTSLAFGSVQVGNSTSLTEILTNTGGSSLTISAAPASGSGFSLSGLSLPLTLTAGQSTSFTVLFSPTTSGSASGSVSITSNGSNPNLSIPLSGTGVTQGALTANPTSLAFGSVQVGNSTSLSETLKNTGGSSVTISQVSSSAAAFSISGLNLPLTLTTNQSVTFTATFAPTSAGAASGNLSVASNASNSPLNIALSGTGTAAGTLAVSPTSLSFGNVTVGSSAALGGSLKATGASVTVSSASLNNSEFVLSGISLPATPHRRSIRYLHRHFHTAVERSHVGVIVILEQRLELAHRANHDRHGNGGDSAHRGPHLDRLDQRRRLQHLPRHRVGWTVHDDQLLARQHDRLHRQHGRLRPDLLLRSHGREFQLGGERILEPSHGGHSDSVTSPSARPTNLWPANS